MLIFCITTGKILKTISLELSSDEFVKTIKADENGFIALVTTKGVILVYKYHLIYLFIKLIQYQRNQAASL